jgi:integrase
MKEMQNFSKKYHQDMNWEINNDNYERTRASLLFEAGASIKEVQERLGHSDIQMTMNIYTHVTDTVKEQKANKFQKYIEL